MPSKSLADLKTRMDALASNGSLVITPAMLGNDLPYSEPLRFVLERLAIRVQRPQVGFVGDSVRVAGVAAPFPPYSARVILTVSETNGRLSAPKIDLDVLSETGRPMGVEDILKPLLGTIKLPTVLSASRLSIGDFGEIALRANINETWPVRLGREIEFRGLEVAIGSQTGTLRGRADIGITQLELLADLSGKFSVKGNLPPVDALTLIDKLAGVTVPIPRGMNVFTLPESQFEISFLAGAPQQLTLNAQDPSLGTICLVVEKLNASWVSALAFQLPENWRFSKLSRLLSPLDMLKIGKPTLVLSSVSRDSLPCPVDLGARKKGLTLTGGLDLNKSGLGLLGTLLKTNILPLDLSGLDDLSHVTLTMAINDPISILKDVIVLSGTRVVVESEPFAITLISTALVTLFKKTLPKMTIGAGFTGTTTRIVATLDKWANPLGINGLTIEKLVLQMETTPAKYAILGKIRVAAKSEKVIMVGAEFTTSAPTMIVGQLQGKLSMQEVLDTLLPGNPIKLSFLDISIRDAMIRLVAMKTEIDNVWFDEGFALQGFLGFFGLEVFIKVVVEPGTRIYAKGDLSQKLDFGGILVITDASGKKGPEVELDTRSTPPSMTLSFGYSLFGLDRETIKAVLNQDGLTFVHDKYLGPFHYNLTVNAKSLSSFTVTGDVDFKLNIHIDDITEPNTGIKLLPAFDLVDVALKATVKVQMAGKHLSQSILLDFKFWGVDFKAGFDFDASLDFNNLPDAIVVYIKDNAFGIFSQLFKDGDPIAILLGLGQGLFEKGKELWDKLWKQFGKTIEILEDGVMKPFAVLGDGVKAVWDAISVVDVLALPAIGSLSLKGWETLTADVWSEAGGWSADRWDEVADFSDEVWERAQKKGKEFADDLKKWGKETDRKKDKFLEDNGMHDLVLLGKAGKKGAEQIKSGYDHAGGIVSGGRDHAVEVGKKELKKVFGKKF